jgi:RimJ/RimL family protein N-acetyltransferase
MGTSLRVEGLDKQDCPYEAVECGRESQGAIVSMYEMFSPKGIAQGLPPARDEDCRNWVCALLEGGENFLVRVEGRVVGHAVLISDLARGDAEYIVFVLEDFRNRGLGSILTSLAMEKAAKIGLKTVWLTVEAYNFRAIRVYKKVGFQFCGDCDRERTMMLSL